MDGKTLDLNPGISKFQMFAMISANSQMTSQNIYIYIYIHCATHVDYRANTSFQTFVGAVIRWFEGYAPKMKL